MLITMKDVAKKAGVSVTTVSRVLNNRGSISEKTRKMVFRTIEELNYHPNEMARSLMTKKTHIIGLIVPVVDHPYFSMVVDAVESLCASSNYKLLLCTSDNSSEKELKLSAMLRANKVDGVIIYSQKEDPSPYMDYELPVVVVDKTLPGIPSVLSDNYQGGSLAARTLIESGSLHPIIFGFESRKNSISERRIAGFRDECIRNGIEYREYIVDNEHNNNIDLIKLDIMGNDFDDHYIKMFERYPDTDGIFTTNEILATKILLKLEKTGKSVPDDVQVIGYDGTILSELMDLTVVNQPTMQICSTVLEILFKRMENKIVPSSTIMPVNIIKRSSTK